MDVSNILAAALFGVGSAAVLLAATHVIFPLRRRTVRCYIAVPEQLPRKAQPRGAKVVVMAKRWEQPRERRAQ